MHAPRNTRKLVAVLTQTWSGQPHQAHGHAAASAPPNKTHSAVTRDTCALVGTGCGEAECSGPVCRLARRLNWREAKGSALVKGGDMISCSGKGRLEVTAVEPTKKGRWAVAMVRYV